MSNIGTIQKNFCTMNQIVGFDKLDCEYLNEAYSKIMSKKENEIAVINQIERYTKGETFDFAGLIFICYRKYIIYICEYKPYRISAPELSLREQQVCQDKVRVRLLEDDS